jgi:hypothetical protein
MTASVRCATSAIAEPLAGAAVAPEAATSPNPVATSTERAVLHIFISSMRYPGGFPGGHQDVPSTRCHQDGCMEARAFVSPRPTGQGRQAHSKQVVAGHATRCGVQAEFRATGPLHQAQGRHQRVRCPFHAVPGARCCIRNRWLSCGQGSSRQSMADGRPPISPGWTPT